MIPRQNPARQFYDGRWLITRRLKLCLQFEPAPTLKLGAGQNIGTLGQGIVVVMGHE
jgi:hypothetical protein